jgi:hypothetical protein
MANSKTTDDVQSELHQFERNRYFYGKLMTVRDFEAEQRYGREARYLHNLALHGWGVVCGLEVQATASTTKLTVTPGVALDCCGREIVMAEANKELDLEQDLNLSVAPGTDTVYLAIRYDDCEREPVPAQAQISTCDEVCDYSRIQERYAFELLNTLPAPPAPPQTCRSWLNLVTVRGDIKAGDATIGEFERTTPAWVNPGDTFTVYRKVKFQNSGTSQVLTDTLPANFSLADGSLALNVVNAIAGKEIYSAYRVKVSATANPKTYDITGVITSTIEVPQAAKPLEAFIHDNFVPCPTPTGDATQGAYVVLARVTLKTDFTIDAVDSVTLDDAKGIYRQVVYATPLVARLLECMKNRVLNLPEMHIEVKDNAATVVTAARSLDFKEGLKATDGGLGQAYISANVAQGIRTVGDQIQANVGPGIKIDSDKIQANVGAGLTIVGDQIRLDRHAASHQSGSTDTINVNNLSGELAQPQKVQVQHEAAAVGTQTCLNFTGAGVAVTEDAANDRVNINIQASAAPTTGRVVIATNSDGIGSATIDSHFSHSAFCVVAGLDLKEFVAYSPTFSFAGRSGTLTIQVYQMPAARVGQFTIDISFPGIGVREVPIRWFAIPAWVLTPSPSPPPTPTIVPTPTIRPTIEPTIEPTFRPTIEPTIRPTIEPTFRPTIGPVGTPRAVTEVTGIGPAYAARLADNNINTLEDMAASEPGHLAEVLGITPVRAMSFIDEARRLLRG